MMDHYNRHDHEYRRRSFTIDVVRESVIRLYISKYTKFSSSGREFYFAV